MIRTPLIHKIVLRRMKKTYFSNLSSIHGRNHYDIVIPFQEITRYFVQDFSIFVRWVNTPGRNSTKSLILLTSMAGQYPQYGV